MSLKRNQILLCLAWGGAGEVVLALLPTGFRGKPEVAQPGSSPAGSGLPREMIIGPFLGEVLAFNKRAWAPKRQTGHPSFQSMQLKPVINLISNMASVITSKLQFYNQITSASFYLRPKTSITLKNSFVPEQREALYKVAKAQRNPRL